MALAKHVLQPLADCWPLVGVSLVCQLFTYGVVSEGVFAEILRKVRGNKKTRFIASGKGAEILQKVCGNLRKFFCNDPFPKDPMHK